MNNHDTTPDDAAQFRLERIRQLSKELVQTLIRLETTTAEGIVSLLTCAVLLTSRDLTTPPSRLERILDALVGVLIREQQALLRQEAAAERQVH